MKKKTSSSSRRTFLAAGSAAVVSSVLTSAIPTSSNIIAAPKILPPPMAEPYHIGYMEIPSEGPVGESIQERRNRLERWGDTIRSRVYNGQLQRMSISPTATLDPLVKAATAIAPDLSLLEKNVAITLMGLYTRNGQWSNNDNGFFRMNMNFDPIQPSNSCSKPVSSATLGASFTAKPNNLVNQFTTFPTFSPIPIASTKKLSLSFDLIDIADEADKSPIEKALKFSQDAAKAAGEIPGVPALPAYGVALTVLNTASSIVNLFVDKPANKLIWGAKSDEGDPLVIDLVTNNNPGQRKLRPGLYFIAGQSRTGAPPRWDNLYLRTIGNPNQTGIEGALYQRSNDGRWLEPVDFTYVKLLIAPAS